MTPVVNMMIILPVLAWFIIYLCVGLTIKIVSIFRKGI